MSRSPTLDLNQIAPAGYYLALRVGFHFPTEEVNRLPPAWVEHYTRCNFMIFDPVNHWVYDNVGTIRWSDIETADPRGVLVAARAHGLAHGLAVSVADGGPGGQRSYGQFCRGDRAYSDDEAAAILAEVERRHRRLAPPSNLTLAELQALKLVKAGLRQKQIAYELGVSEGAIKQRLKSARIKLGAATGAQATTIASTFNLI